MRFESNGYRQAKDVTKRFRRNLASEYLLSTASVTVRDKQAVYFFFGMLTSTSCPLRSTFMSFVRAGPGSVTICS